MSNAKEPTISFDMPLEKFLSTCMLVPIGDPLAESCIWGLPVMLHGSPGIAKTARIHQASDAVGLSCMAVELGGRQPEDAGGAPFVTKNSQGQDMIVIACILPAINELNAMGRGVLFLDELTCGRPATQGAFLTCVQERRVGDTKFSPKIRIVCAGNPPNESAGGYTLQLPMANRMAHRDVSPPSVEEFTTYLIQGPSKSGESIEEGERIVTEAWSDHYPVTVGHIAGFLKQFPQHLFCIPKQGHPARGKAFPTHRTMDYATRAVATARILHRDVSEQTELFASCVGAAAASDFDTWVQESRLPDPVSVLQEGWKPDKTRLDRTHAVYAGMIAYVLGRQKKEDRLDLAPLAWKRLSDLIDSGIPDVGLPHARALMRAGFSSKASKEVAEASRPVSLYYGRKGFQDLVEP